MVDARNLKSPTVLLAGIAIAAFVFAFLAPESRPIVAGLLAASATYAYTELSKGAERAWLRREERYTRLLRGLPGLQGGGKFEDRQAFVAEWYQAWLYCPDNVIRAGNRFLDSIRLPPDAAGDVERRAALNKFLVAIRRDIGIRTKLGGDDFRIVSARPDQIDINAPPGGQW